jgi:hypothetical protein
MYVYRYQMVMERVVLLVWVSNMIHYGGCRGCRSCWAMENHSNFHKPMREPHDVPSPHWSDVRGPSLIPTTLSTSETVAPSVVSPTQLLSAPSSTLVVPSSSPDSTTKGSTNNSSNIVCDQCTNNNSIIVGTIERTYQQRNKTRRRAMYQRCPIVTGKATTLRIPHFGDGDRGRRNPKPFILNIPKRYPHSLELQLIKTHLEEGNGVVQRWHHDYGRDRCVEKAMLW